MKCTADRNPDDCNSASNPNGGCNRLGRAHGTKLARDMCPRASRDLIRICDDWKLQRFVLPENKDSYKYFYPKNFNDAITQCKATPRCVAVGTYNSRKFAMLFFNQHNINVRKQLSLDHNDEWTLCADPKHIQHEKKCDETIRGDKATGYRGCQTQTKSGRTCQAWSAQSPHTQTVGSSYKDVVKSNYCRNPGGLHQTLWCYTMEKGMRAEYCDPL